MNSSAVPDFFSRFPMAAVTSGALDAVLAGSGTPLAILFLWGLNCPNCDVAKRAILLTPERFRWPEVGWLQDNVYDDPEMATRFGLHGVPTFIVFRDGRSRGRITSWPGTEDFVAAIDKQRAG